MAIAFDNVGSLLGDNRRIGTLSVVVGTSSNMVLFVCPASEEIDDIFRPVLNIVYAGSNLTKAVELSNLTDNVTSGIWYLANAPAGTANAIVTWTGTCKEVAFVAISLSGVNTSAPIDGTAGINVSNPGTLTGTITTTADNCWILDNANCTLPTDIVAGTSQTERARFDYGVTTAAAMGVSTRGPITPAATVIGTWVGISTDDYSYTLVSVAPAPAGVILDQNHYRFFDDDVGLNTATALANEDANISGVATLDNFRIRNEVANTGGATGTITRQIEWRQVGGAWAALGTATTAEVYITLSSVFADGAATTNRLTATGTFVAGQGKESGSQTGAGTIPATNFIEDEWNIVFGTAAIAGQAYEFRITKQGTALDTYTKYGTATVFAAAAAYSSFRSLTGVGI